jgi:hypothetical protein
VVLAGVVMVGAASGKPGALGGCSDGHDSAQELGVCCILRIRVNEKLDQLVKNGSASP